MHRWYVVEVDISGRRDSRFLSTECAPDRDQAPWRQMPQPFGGMAGAADRITAAGFPVLLPVQRSLDHHPRTKAPMIVARPSFPGFLLVQFDIADETWKAIARLRGVWGFLTLGSEIPPPVRQAEVERLIASDIATATLTLDDMLRQRRRPMREPLPIASPVVVEQGPFAGRAGFIESDEGREKLRVELGGWLGTVTLPAEHVRAA